MSRVLFAIVLVIVIAWLWCERPEAGESDEDASIELPQVDPWLWNDHPNTRLPGAIRN